MSLNIFIVDLRYILSSMQMRSLLISFLFSGSFRLFPCRYSIYMSTIWLNCLLLMYRIRSLILRALISHRNFRRLSTREKIPPQGTNTITSRRNSPLRQFYAIVSRGRFLDRPFSSNSCVKKFKMISKKKTESSSTSCINLYE